MQILIYGQGRVPVGGHLTYRAFGIQLEFQPGEQWLGMTALSVHTLFWLAAGHLGSQGF